VENRRLFLAVLLSFLVLLAWSFLFPPERPEMPPEVTEETAPPQQRVIEPEPAQEELPPVTALEPSPPADFEGVEAETQERVVVETARFRAIFTNRGAQLLSFELRDHFVPPQPLTWSRLLGRDATSHATDAAGQMRQPVDLVRRREHGPYPFALVGPHGRSHSVNEALFVVERGGRGAHGSETLGFRYRGDLGAVEKVFTFRPDGMFEVEVRGSVQGGWGLLVGPAVRNPSSRELADRFRIRQAVIKIGDEVERIGAQGAEEPQEISGLGLRWIGLEDTYFLTAHVATEPLHRALVEPILVDEGPSGAARFAPLRGEDELTKEQKELTRELQLILEPAGESLALVGYWGAKVYDRLASLPYGLEQTISLGFFGFLSRPLLIGLRWTFNNVVENYGWAIILMTVLIKVLLFPLTHKSYVSMQKMQELQPKMKAVREKYRSKMRDKRGRMNMEVQRKMNEEMTALYRKEGVNPAGGCLPMLLQIPVLFAFYRLLMNAVELRNAPWVFWVDDLASHDPLYVLPLVMGATQFLQQKMTPAAGDPMQRRMFQFMPVIFTVLFLRFPAGLVLYWLTNNVLTIVQQMAYKRHKEASQPVKAGKGTRAKAGGK
jgi:YidC/Oxa1 family membrane protein insertase